MWKTYKQVYDEVLDIGSALRASGAEPVCTYLLTYKLTSFFSLHIIKESSQTSLFVAGLSNWNLWI